MRMDQFLSQMLAKVEEHQAMIEKECSVLRELLKPWSQDDNANETNIPKEAEDTNVNINKEEGLSVADRLALEQVDQLLSKAKWTRESKLKKLNRDDASLSTGESLPNENDPSNRVCDRNLEEYTAHPNLKIDTGQKKHTHKGKKKAPQSYVTRISVIKSESATKSVSHSVRKSMSQSSSATFTRPSSRQSDYIPAHMSAPFKTDVHLHVPNRKLYHLKKNQIKTDFKDNKGFHSLESSSFKTLPRIKSELKAAESKKSIERDHDPESPRPVSKVEKEYMVMSEVSDVHSTMCASEPTSENGCGFTETEKCPGNSNNNLKVKVANEGKTKSLKDKSIDLKIPSKLKKLYMTNTTLLKECHDAKIFKKVTSADPAQTFIQKLQSQMEVPEELWTRDRALSCLKVHDLMLKTAQCLGLDTLTDKSSYDVMYAAKKKLEWVLCMFGQLQDEAEYFSNVQFRPIPDCISDNCEEIDYIEDHIQRHFDALQENETEILDAPNRPLVQIELGGSQRWVHLKFTKFFYHLHLYLMSLAEREWFHLLSCDQRDKSCHQLVYSLMTTNGEYLPAFIDNSALSF